MTRKERIKELKKKFKTLLEKLNRIIKTTDRENGVDEVIDVIQLTYFIYHKMCDNLTIIKKL